MPKQPDLIAAEMQGDATISHAIEQAVAQAYESSKNDPSVVESLKQMADEGMRELAGEAPEPEPEAGHATNGESSGSRRGLRGIFSRR